MRKILLQSSNEKDLQLLLVMANRLGILYQELEENNSPIHGDKSPLCQNLGLEDDMTFMRYGELEEDPVIIPPQRKTSLNECFGAWESDETETLEELLSIS